MAPLINGLGHWRGAQNFENTAYNSRLLAWVTGGESLHNNHHAHPRSPKFSMRRSEFDPSWPIIRSLAALRLLAIQGAARRVGPAATPRRVSVNVVAFSTPRSPEWRWRIVDQTATPSRSPRRASRRSRRRRPRGRSGCISTSSAIDHLRPAHHGDVVAEAARHAEGNGG